MKRAVFCFALVVACKTTNGDPGDSAATDAGRTTDAGLALACGLSPEPGDCNGGIVRYYHDASSGTCEELVYGGCGGNANNFETLAECEESCGVSPRSVPCAVDATDPSVPGARLHVEAERCRVQSDRTHEFHYTLELAESLSAEIPDSHGSCGICDISADPRSFVDFRIGSPLEPHYCECAGGCCPATTAHSQSLNTGTFEHTIVWPGRQWNGGSDTSEPLGPPFPPGTFPLNVTFSVLGKGSITATLPLEVFAASP